MKRLSVQPWRELLPMLLRRLARCPFGALGLVAGVGVGFAASVPEAPIRGFTLPLVDRETLKLRARVRGDLAQPMGSDQMEIQGVQLEGFTPEQTTNLVVTTDRCRLYLKERRLESSSELRVRTGDGQLSLSGRGFRWEESEGLVISNRVEAELIRPATAPAGRPGPARAVREGPVHIRSDRFTYGSGAAVFSGQVVVTEGEDRMECGRLTLGMDLEPGELTPRTGGEGVQEVVRRVIAEESVHLVSSNVVANATQATYDLAEEILRLGGGVDWTAGDREGASDTMVLYRREDRVEADGGVRIRLPAAGLGTGLSSWPGEARPAAAPLGSAPAATERVEVRASRLHLDPDPGQPGVSVARFFEPVSVVQGEGELHCRELSLRYTWVGGSEREEAPASMPSGLHVLDALADGGVALWQSTNRVEGAQASYRSDTGVVEMAGPVRWVREGREGRSDLLRMDPREGLTEARGDVRMLLPAGGLGALDRTLAAQDDGTGQAAGSAAAPPAGEPVEIRCREVRYRETRGEAAAGRVEFVGDVEVSSGPNLNLRCGRLLLDRGPGTNQVSRLVATEDVVIRSEDKGASRTARGDRAEYMGAEEQLWLSGVQGVKIDSEDKTGASQGWGRLAVYDGRTGVLELRTEARLESGQGTLTGDHVRVDRSRQLMSAGGMWRVQLGADALADAKRKLLEGASQP